MKLMCNTDNDWKHWNLFCKPFSVCYFTLIRVNKLPTWFISISLVLLENNEKLTAFNKLLALFLFPLFI